MLRTLEALVTARSENRVMNAAASPLPPHAFCSQTTQDVLQQIIKIDNYLWFIDNWSSEEFFSQSNYYHGKYWNLINSIIYIYLFNTHLSMKWRKSIDVCGHCGQSPLYIAKISCLPIGFFICLLLVVRDDQSWQCVCCCCREIEMGSCCCNLQSAVICQADSANFSIKQFLPFLLTFAIVRPASDPELHLFSSTKILLKFL